MKRPDKPPQSGVLIATLCLIAALFAPVAMAEVRVLVWASDYKGAGNADLELPNTLVDARTVAAMFRALHVQDLKLIENPNAETWTASLKGLLAVSAPTMSWCCITQATPCR